MQSFLQVTAQAFDQGLWVGGVQTTRVRAAKLADGLVTEWQ